MTPLALATGTAAALAVVGGSFRVRVADVPRAVHDRADTSSINSAWQSRRSVVIGALGAIAIVGVVIAGPALTAIIGGAGCGVVVSRHRRAARSARLAIDASMPDAVELLVMCLHSGYSPTQAVTQLARDAPAPLRPAFGAVEQRLHRGSGFADALGELTAACGRCALPLVTSMSAAMRDGLPLAPVLDRLTDEAIDSRRRHGEAAARRLPVRLSFPLVVCTLPSFVLLAIAPAVLGALSTLQGSTP
jgi:Flp pilus assembly protein TadB